MGHLRLSALDSPALCLDSPTLPGPHRRQAGRQSPS